jgi:iron complex transport system substrate-binding protein
MSLQRYLTALNAKLLLLGFFTGVNVLASSLSFAQNKPAPSYPQRIITVAPHLSEVVESAGGANRLISVSAYSNFPDLVKQLPITSDARSIDLEKMKQLRPDLIIYWRGGTPETQIESIKKTFTSISVVSVEPKKLTDIANDIESIGKLLGTETIAKKNADTLRSQINDLKKRYQNKHSRKVRVFYQVWAQPLMTLNQDHLIADIISICGGEQLFAKEKLLVPTVSREAVVKANPEIIFTAVDTKQMKTDWSMWSSIPQLAATQKKAFVDIDGDMISRPSSRIMQGAQKICSEIDKIR